MGRPRYRWLDDTENDLLDLKMKIWDIEGKMIENNLYFKTIEPRKK
jgi:hypothetical protein